MYIYKLTTNFIYIKISVNNKSCKVIIDSDICNVYDKVMSRKIEHAKDQGRLLLWNIKEELYWESK